MNREFEFDRLSIENHNLLLNVIWVISFIMCYYALGVNIVLIIFSGSIVASLVTISIIECVRCCCPLDERQAVMAPYGRQPYD